MSIRIKLSGIKAINQKLTRVDRVALDENAIAFESSKLLLRLIKERYKAGEDPDGNKWPISKAAQSGRSSRKGKKRRGGTLLDTGRMFDNLLLFSASKGVSGIISETPYGKYHQNPDNINSKPEGRLPRRIFLGIGDADTKAICELVQARIERSAGG